MAICNACCTTFVTTTIVVDSNTPYIIRRKFMSPLRRCDLYLVNKVYMRFSSTIYLILCDMVHMSMSASKIILCLCTAQMKCVMICDIHTYMKMKFDILQKIIKRKFFNKSRNKQLLLFLFAHSLDKHKDSCCFQRSVYRFP